MLSLLLPKDGARDAGQQKRIALLPQVYGLWSAACKRDVQQLLGGALSSRDSKSEPKIVPPPPPQ
eukprot:2400339-Amphidinium_carterae.1